MHVETLKEAIIEWKKTNLDFDDSISFGKVRGFGTEFGTREGHLAIDANGGLGCTVSWLTFGIYDMTKDVDVLLKEMNAALLANKIESHI